MISHEIESDCLRVAHVTVAEVLRAVYLILENSNLVRAFTVLLCLAVGWFALSININNGNNNDDDNNESI